MARKSLIALLIVSFVMIQLACAQIELECPSHSTYNPCMTRCPITCSNIQNPPKCLEVCTVGCECQPGFIKANKAATSQCVKLYECSRYTKRPMTYPMLRNMIKTNKSEDE